MDARWTQDVKAREARNQVSALRESTASSTLKYPRLMRELIAEIHKNEAQAEFDASAAPPPEVDREVLAALYVRLRLEAGVRQ